MVALYSILVRRDTHTTTQITAPEYELPLLQEIFGVENVHNADGKRVDEHGLAPAVGQFSPSGDEYERFCAKYGIELVERVCGKSKTGQGSRLRDECSGFGVCSSAQPSALTLLPCIKAMRC